MTLLSQFAQNRLFDVRGKIQDQEGCPPPLPPPLVSYIQPEFEVWMWVLWDFLYCPYDQSFQSKWRNRGEVDFLMESTPFDFFDPQISTQYLLRKWPMK